jgi:trigger factor
MTLKVDVQTVDSLRRRLAVEVPAEQVSAEIEKAYTELGRAAKVKGFRPGRVPRHVLERMFGDRIRADVFGRLIQDSYAEIIEAHHIDAVGQPEIVTEQAEPGGVLRYSATVEVKPEVVVNHYSGLEVERPVVAVTGADVDAALERLRGSFAQLRPIAERSQVEHGDVVALDYEARVDGRVVGRGENRDIEIGQNGFPPAFDGQLIGAAVGADLDFDVSYAADHGTAELAGKTVRFHVRVRGLSQKELPPLDDEFAKDHGECATLEELRGRLRQRLENEAARYADEAVRRAVVAEFAKAHDVPVPDAMVRRRTDALVEEVWHEWQQRRIQPKSQSEALARLRAELEPRAREQVKIGLLLEALARQEAISVNDDELEARIAVLAAEAGAAADRVRALYQESEARRQLRSRMIQSRAIDVLVRHARTKDAPHATHVAEVGENG